MIPALVLLLGLLATPQPIRCEVAGTRISDGVAVCVPVYDVDEMMDLITQDPEWQARQAALVARQARVSRPAATPPAASTTTVTTPPADTTCQEISNPGPVYLTERTMSWCPLVDEYWPDAQVRTALLIAECESNGDPQAVNPLSGTSGLFQHRPRYWAGRSTRALGYVADVADPRVNVAVAYDLWRRDGWAVHWGGGGCWDLIQDTLARG